MISNGFAGGYQKLYENYQIAYKYVFSRKINDFLF